MTIGQSSRGRATRNPQEYLPQLMTQPSPPSKLATLKTQLTAIITRKPPAWETRSQLGSVLVFAIDTGLLRGDTCTIREASSVVFCWCSCYVNIVGSRKK
jgi:hypothetical protein